jgi:hypothetical protein
MRKSLGRRHEAIKMPLSIRVQFDEGTSETLEVTDLGGGIIRLEATPLSAPTPLYRGDTIEVVATDPAFVQFVRVIEPGPDDHQSWIVSQGFPGSTEYLGFVQIVEAAGGQVENVAGGVLHVHLPPNSGVDADSALDMALGEHARRTEPLRSRLWRWLTGKRYERPSWPAA